MMNKTVFNSSTLPTHLDDRARFSLWYETYSTTTLRSANVSRLPDRPFSANWQFQQSGIAIIDRFDSTLEKFSRRAAAQPVDRYCMAFNAGPSQVSVAQRGRELVGGKNNAGFFCMADATDIVGEGDGLSWIGMSVPRKDLLDRVPNADDLVLKPLDPGMPALRHLRSYLGLLADPAFSTSDIGAKLGVSANYVQKILHETGSNFTERVQELRLQKARIMLAGPQHRHVKVSEIAYACGFNEISYFNRRFRRRFGAAPNDFRCNGSY